MVGNRATFFSHQIKNSLIFSIQRVLIIVVSIFIGAAVSSAFLNIYFDIDTKISKELKAYGANFTLSPKDTNNDFLSYDEYEEALKKIPAGKLNASSPFLYGLFNLGSTTGVVAGIEFDEFKKTKPFIDVVKGSFSPTDFEDDRAAFLGLDLKNILETDVGKPITIFYPKTQSQKTFTIKGILQAGDEIDGMMLIRLKEAQDLLGDGAVINYANAIVDGDFNSVSAIAKDISTDTLDASVVASVSLSEGVILQKIKSLMALVSIIVLVISSTSVNTTLSSIIFSRKKEVALHIALGASKKDVVSLFGWECFILAIISSVLGAFAGYLLAQILGHLIFNAGIDFRISGIVASVLISLFCAFVAAYFPIKKALSIDIVENLRGE